MTLVRSYGKSTYATFGNVHCSPNAEALGVTWKMQFCFAMPWELYQHSFGLARVLECFTFTSKTTLISKEIISKVIVVCKKQSLQVLSFG